MKPQAGKHKRGERGSTEEEPTNEPKRPNMAAEQNNEEAKLEEPSLSEISQILLKMENTMSTILSENSKLTKELVEVRHSYESQKTELNALRLTVDKTSNMNKALQEELANAQKKIKEQADDITNLYNLQDDLEQYTRKNSLEMCGIPESVYNSTEKVVMKLSEVLDVTISHEDIEISHKLNRIKAGAEPGIKPIIVKFVSHKVKTLLYKQRTKLKDI